MRAFVASAIAAFAALAAAGCGGGDETPTLPEGRFMAASQSITPRVHLFAEPITARVDVIVDTERYDAHRIRLVTEF